MWQFVFVAAVAGSGILVKRFFRNGDGRGGGGGGGDHHPVRVSEQSKLGKEEENVMEVQRKEEQESFDIMKPDALITSLALGVPSSGGIGGGDSWMLSERHHSVVEEDEGIFRFASLDRGEGSGSRSGLLKTRRSTTSRGEKIKKRLLLMLEDQRNKGMKVSFCLKKRRTGKNAFRKCGSCSSRAGKAEINKLNVDIEERTEVISNLQSEVCKRKLSLGLQDSSCEDRTNMETVDRNKEPLVVTNSSVKLASTDDPEVFDLSSNGDGECASSILTEEVDLEALEMDKLEAELECELQKIPNESDTQYFMEFPSTELSAYALEGPQEPFCMDPNSSQIHGVSPTELDRKLCHVLIKQQESQIAELESNLYLSQMKLREKDAELRALKAVVCSLRDFSLETASEDGVVLDDEEEEEEKEMNINADSLTCPRSVDDSPNRIVIVKDQKLLCGVKRVMEFESYVDSQVIHNVLVS